jgi:multiple RNA-binding domain-containing protein 1
LFVRNLPFAATEEELQEHFSSFGTITSCHIPVDDQKRNKGFAFVSFETSVAAQQAMSELDGTDFQGRLLHILPARKGPNETAQDDTIDESNLTYKQKQDLERRKEASKSSQGWSASFVRGDAVVDNLADRLGLRKGDILNVKEGLSSGDAAVRLALGETHIIEENREYFRKEGVDMDALVSAKGEADDKSVKRSSTNILVKNLPYDTELEELTKIFYGIGGDPPKRILLPPSRTIAMAEYGHSSDARRAFRKLAYRRFKHVPLYLEWAPLTAQVKDKDEGVISRQDQPSDHAILEEEKPALDDEDDVDLEPSLSHTIYVKNLNFATTEEELRKIFSKHAKKIRAVKIPTKTAPVKRVRGDKSESPPVKTLSMGFGFVECDSEESVRKAIKALQGAIIDGHALELKRSAKRIDLSSSKKDSPVPGSARKSTKIVVRNVPFQASRKELLQLFGSFGQLKKVRLPKKFDGTHRGFAFVDYLTHQEALTAMNTLSRTHLYGRHLVLEWASDKDDVDTLREKAKRDVSIEAQKPRQNKKIRFN